MNPKRFLLFLCAGFVAVASLSADAPNNFVNWENPHVHPLDLTPDRTRLLAVNTPDARLEVFDTTGASLALLDEIPVGLDPVSVRARTNGEVWVVNHISDSVSVVDLSTRRVVATLKTDDEPADVVFAGNPERAFVSCSQANSVLVFDPANLATAPVRIAIDGEDPRALAVSTDRSKVFVAIFESGNSTTILGGGAQGPNISFPPNAVGDPAGPWGGQNPPPNAGTGFNPPLNPLNPPPPKVGLIVRKNALGRWLDDNNGDWSSFVSGSNAALSGRTSGWDLYDNDVAVIDASSLSVSYARRLMNLCMAIAVNPGNGEVTVVGTDATNEIRYEPVLRGRFLRVEIARVDPNTPSGPSAISVGDLNPHLTYATGSVAPSERAKSIGDPRGIVWTSSGLRGYVSGMGSNNVVVIDGAGNRVALSPPIQVGEGPTGLALDEPRQRLYVLDKFAASISVVDTQNEHEIARVPFFDPSPHTVKLGRRQLYDTHRTSGLGHIACASCHVDAHLDRLAWDLGDPAGGMRPVAGQNLGANLPGLTGGFQDFHPMKGPMTTQTLQDIIGKEPFHWRGDRNGLHDFNAAFMSLQGAGAQLTNAEMQQYSYFLATIAFPPNPYRNFDNTLPASLPLPGHFTTGRFGPAGQPLPNGDATAGLVAFRTQALLNGATNCVTCHTLPAGLGTDFTRLGNALVPFPTGADGEHHHALVAQDGSTNVSMKVPQLRNLLEKTGFNLGQVMSPAGFGYLHDGSIDSIERFVSEPAFNVSSDQEVADLTALLLSFSGSGLPPIANPPMVEPPGTPSQDTHAAVGVQTTLASSSPAPAQAGLILGMLQLADANKVGVMVKGFMAGIRRGFCYALSGNFQSDRAVQMLTLTQLQALASPGSELTFTVVPRGDERRLGIDRDLDGFLDRDEIDAGTDPANEESHLGLPGRSLCYGDGSGTPCPCGNDSTGNREGCLNSSGVGGKLSASGVASLASDSVVLIGVGMPAIAPCLYIQGTQLQNGGLGSTFGDGLMCAAGTVRPIGKKINSGGGSHYPGAGDPAVSVAGAVSAPGTTREYQLMYRNPRSTCTPNTFNTSNAWEITWGP